MEKVQPDAFIADCPSRDILARLAEKWTMLTLASLQPQPLRFGEIRRKIGGISQKMLTKTLRKLEADGMVTRTVFDEMPLRVEYALTPLGLGCADLVGELKSWVETHMQNVLDAQSEARHGEGDGQ